MAAYQKDFIETQSMEDRSKNPEQSLAFSGTAFASANRKTVSHFSKSSPRIIQSTKANETHSPQEGGTRPVRSMVGTPLRRNDWFFLSPW